MGKKSKGKHAAQTGDSSNTAGMINIALIIGAVLLAAGIIWSVLRGPAEPIDRAALPKPSVATMDPEQFNGRTRLAYEAAKAVPEVLAQLPCYCGCMSGAGHRNNLDCFRDFHGVECTMCQDIALDAQDMWNDGYQIDRIRETIRTRYGRYAAVEHGR